MVTLSLKSYRFELDSSKRQSKKYYPFSIDYLKLQIQPNMTADHDNLIGCREELEITVNEDITEIELDVAELKIHRVFNQVTNKEQTESNNEKIRIEELLYNEDYYDKDKLIIQMGQLKQGDKITLCIEYSAGYYESKYSPPRSGFHFILDKQQAWTQGETIESRYWFPCLDDPQIKFPREIGVIVPKEFTVISNGTEEINDLQLGPDTGNNNKLSVWKHLEKDQTYVTAVAIGKFVKRHEVFKSKISNRNIELSYFWPDESNDQEQDPMLTFSVTPSIMEFIETYTQTGYPYENYKQVAVNDFDFGGMENTTCTIIAKEFFHDDKSKDHTNDRDLICHELAHQWFGDSVTCKTWSNIWLNEGFASYFESLYLLHIPTSIHSNEENKSSISTDEITSRQSEFYNSLIKKTLTFYFGEYANKYQRSIVTNVYHHPDDMFDSHSYRKGAFFLHMLRNKIGEDAFRKCLKLYLAKFHGKTAETDDFRNVCEITVGQDLEDFFEQWLYRDGHPVLNITVTSDKFQEAIFGINLTIEQLQNEKISKEKEFQPFNFPLEVKIYFIDSDDNEQKITKSIVIDKLKENYPIDLKESRIKQLSFISFDPDLKILKQIKTLNLKYEDERFSLLDMLLNQLRNGETIVERLDAISFLQTHAKNYIRDKSSIDEICKTLKESILSDPFYSVSANAAITFGSLYDDTKKHTNQIFYEALNHFFTEEYLLNHFFNLDPRVRKDLVHALGFYKNESAIKALKKIFHKENSPFVKYESIIAIAKCTHNLDLQEKEHYIEELKDLAYIPSFRYNNTRATIIGLIEITKSISTNKKIIDNISAYIIEKTKSNNPFDVRLDAINQLGNLIRYEDGEINRKVFFQLISLLNEPRFGLQQAVCRSLVHKRAIPYTKKDNKPKMFLPDEYTKETIEKLTNVAENDLDGWVRREAEVSLNKIKDWFTEWSDSELILDRDIRKS